MASRKTKQKNPVPESMQIKGLLGGEDRLPLIQITMPGHAPFQINIASARQIAFQILAISENVLAESALAQFVLDSTDLGDAETMEHVAKDVLNQFREHRAEYLKKTNPGRMSGPEKADA